MTTQLDYSVGLAKESTYGTAATPTRFVESEAKMQLDLAKTQSKIMRPGKRVNRLNRNVLSEIDVSGDIETEVTTKGLGYLIEAALGVVTNTMIEETSPAVYQQVHTVRKTDPVTSYTIQEVLPTIGGGSGQPQTFVGCICESIEFSAKTGDSLVVKTSWIGRDMNTSTAAAAASYPVDDDLFHFVHAQVGYAGSLTVPTATALASLSGIASSNVTDISVKVANNLDTGGYTAGGAGRRARPGVLGRADVSGKITAEYTDNTLRDAYLAGTALPLVLTFQHTKVLSSTPSSIYAVLQIVLPAVKLKGEVPASNGGEVITQSIDWEAFDNGAAAEPIWVVYRTLDTAV